MSRIFSVRINLDEIASSLEVCFTDADRSAWLRGFMVGCRGGQIPPSSAPMVDGHRLGLEAHAGAIAHQKRAAEGGRKAAQVRPDTLHKGRVTDRVNSESTPECSPESTPKCSSESTSGQSNNRTIEESNKPPIQQTTEPAADAADDFMEFWEAYNHKKGKPAAMRAWKRLSKADREAAIDGIGPYQKTVTDRQYLKHPATYLNGRAWEDDHTQSASTHGHWVTSSGKVCPYRPDHPLAYDWWALNADPQDIAR